MNLDITPDPGFFSAFPHLNYRAWYALAEFVDNSVQSYEHNKEALRQLHGQGFKLVIKIDIKEEGKVVTIRDNAAGISNTDFPRAFKVAAVPPDRKGLSEFGMGMKTAACWFAPWWSVRTSSLGDPAERTIVFDVPRIVKESLRGLDVTEHSTQADTHFTEVTLKDLYHPIASRTRLKIKEHLACMYRQFLESGEVEMQFNGEPLVYKHPQVLEAPYYKEPDESPREWRKQVDFMVDDVRVHGFIALSATMNNSIAGLSLFRRHRLIIGSADDTYRPKELFGSPNSFEYRRIFGDLNLDGIGVTHTKDGFTDWESFEPQFLKALADQADSSELPIRRQGANFRAAPRIQTPMTAPPFTGNLPPLPPSWWKEPDIVNDIVTPIVKGTVGIVQDPGTPQILSGFGAGASSSLTLSPSESPIPSKWEPATHEFKINFEEIEWNVRVELTDDAAVGDWVEIFEYPTATWERKLGIRLSLAHPFTLRFAGPNYEDLAPLLRVGIALCLAECTARDAGVANAGLIRSCFNSLLRAVMSKPELA